jgi:hypothetical protein
MLTPASDLSTEKCFITLESVIQTAGTSHKLLTYVLDKEAMGWFYTFSCLQSQ